MNAEANENLVDPEISGEDINPPTEELRSSEIVVVESDSYKDKNQSEIESVKDTCVEIIHLSDNSDNNTTSGFEDYNEWENSQKELSTREMIKKIYKEVKQNTNDLKYIKKCLKSLKHEIKIISHSKKQDKEHEQNCDKTKKAKEGEHEQNSDYTNKTKEGKSIVKHRYDYSELEITKYLTKFLNDVQGQAPHGMMCRINDTMWSCIYCGHQYVQTNIRRHFLSTNYHKDSLKEKDLINYKSIIRKVNDNHKLNSARGCVLCNGKKFPSLEKHIQKVHASEKMNVRADTLIIGKKMKKNADKVGEEEGDQESAIMQQGSKRKIPETETVLRALKKAKTIERCSSILLSPLIKSIKEIPVITSPIKDSVIMEKDLRALTERQVKIYTDIIHQYILCSKFDIKYLNIFLEKLTSCIQERKNPNREQVISSIPSLILLEFQTTYDLEDAESTIIEILGKIIEMLYEKGFYNDTYAE